MLTIENVNKIYREGYDLRFEAKPPPEEKGCLGITDPALLDIIIYTDNHKTIRERDITILHEFIHAAEEVGSKRSPDECNCTETDEQAIEIMEKHPEILQHIKNLYYIED